MKCIVIESNGTPHIYGTLKEARAELKANGYSYSRAEDRYYIAGTEYTARIVRSDSDEYAEIMEASRAFADIAKESAQEAATDEATKKHAEKQAERYAMSADINETRAYDEMQEALAAIKRGDIESAETAAEWAKTYADRTESDAAKAAAAAEQAGTANAAEWADQAKGRIDYARRCANAAAEELAAAKVEGRDITIDKFVTTTADEWGEAFGLIDLKAGTTAYQLKTTAHLYTIGFTEAWDGSGTWVCQIDEMQDGHMGGCEACYVGETPTEALENACVEACVYQAMRENDNAEDAVNAASYGAFEMLHSHQWPQTNEQYAELDRMMGTAANIVHRSGKAYGIVWEPYRECDEQAENAANALLAAYADTISTNSAEYRAAHNVAAEEVAGLEAVADMTDREIVARMVEEIAKGADVAKADARAEWSGEGLYRIAWSDGGQKSDPHHYETAEELAADLTSAYQHATPTHQPYAERLEYYERAELLAYLGTPSDFDVSAIEAEATDTDEHGSRYWTADAEELEAIAKRNQR